MIFVEMLMFSFLLNCGISVCKVKRDVRAMK